MAQQKAASRGLMHVSNISGDTARLFNDKPGFSVMLCDDFTLAPDETFRPSLVEKVRFLRCRLREFEGKLRRMR